jgi:hypothetical protein
MMMALKGKFWPASSHCAKEVHSPHRGSISSKYYLPVKISLLRCNSYAEAKGWGDLENAFTESLKNSSLDEFVLLLCTTLPGPRGWSKYVRPVSYNTLGKVPELLLSIPPNASRAGNIPARQQRPLVEAATGVRPDGDHGRQGRQERIDISQERIADGKEAGKATSSGDHGIPQERIVDGKEAEVVMPGGDHEQEIDEIRANAAKAIQYAYRRHLEQKRARAARKIQAAYRRHLRRKSVVRRGIDATQAQYWYLLRRRSMEMKWSKGSRYYILFRVPLAYILVCLDAIKAFAESEKKEAKKRVLTEDNRELEKLMKALRQYWCATVDWTLYRGFNISFSELLKKTVALQKKLSPSSKFHEGRSVSDLQDAVLEVKVIVESLGNIPGSTGTMNQIKKRWDRGWSWILEKQGSRAIGRKAEKPKLTLDREDLYYL